MFHMCILNSKKDKKWYLGYTKELRKRKAFPISNGEKEKLRVYPLETNFLMGFPAVNLLLEL